MALRQISASPVTTTGRKTDQVPGTPQEHRPALTTLEGAHYDRHLASRREALNVENVIWIADNILGYFVDTGSGDVDDLCLAQSRVGNVCAVADGSRMRTKESMLEELSRALRFPNYFGWNWDALEECLWDLSWLPGNDVVLIIRNASALLRAPSPDRRILFQTLLSHPTGILTMASDDTGNDSRRLRILFVDRAEAQTALLQDVASLAGEAG